MNALLTPMTGRQLVGAVDGLDHQVVPVHGQEHQQADEVLELADQRHAHLADGIEHLVDAEPDLHREKLPDSWNAAKITETRNPIKSPMATSCITRREYPPMSPGMLYPLAATTGKITSVMRNETSALILNGITSLEKNGAITIMAFIRIMISRKTWK